MRAREKVREHIELHLGIDGGLLFWRHPSHWNDQAPSLDEQRAEARRLRKETGGKVVRVTRYRLAPLVELPAWSTAHSTPGYWTTQKGDAVFAFVLDDRSDSIEWRAGRGDRSRFAKSVDEAKTACESRLRELGYRVAKA